MSESPHASPTTRLHGEANNAPVFVVRHPASGRRYREVEGGWLILVPLTYTIYPSEGAARAAVERMLTLVRPSARSAWAVLLEVATGEEGAVQ